MQDSDSGGNDAAVLGDGHMTPHEQAVDRTLGRLLIPPALPGGFRARLLATLASERSSLEEARQSLQREHRERLAELETSYVRLRRRTLGTLLGSAFASGAAVTLALPWLHSMLGDFTPMALGATGGLIALAIGIASLTGVRMKVLE